jgi:hypothetical protein
MRYLWCADRQFQVRLQHYVDTGMARRLHGDYILEVGNDDIALRHCRRTGSTDDLSGDGDDVIVRWQLCNIRKLKSESCDDGFGDVITLVTMRYNDLLYGVNQLHGYYLFYCATAFDGSRLLRGLIDQFHLADILF